LVSNRTLRRDFLDVGPQNIWAQKLPNFDDFATLANLRTNISSEEHDLDNHSKISQTLLYNS